MLAYLTLIFACQLAGELLSAALALPLPGPVVGMALLFAGLMLRGAIPDDLAVVGDGLVGNLSLMFVPAGVGVMLHADLIARDWMAIVIALCISTALAIAVTASVMARLADPEAR